MAKKGLTKELIIEAAVALIEEKGLANFSLRNLASSLGIQVSSLYNHIEGQNDLLMEAGFCAVNMLTEREENAIQGKTKDEALFALADAYRLFAKEHTELYSIVMGAHILNIPVLEKASKTIVQPILRVIADYGITGDMQIHYQRILRSVMHGFFAHENVGGFSGSNANRDESYKIAIACVAAQLRATGRSNA